MISFDGGVAPSSFRRREEARRTAQSALETHQAELARAASEADYLRHAADELKKLAPKTKD